MGAMDKYIINKRSHSSKDNRYADIIRSYHSNANSTDRCDNSKRGIPSLIPAVARELQLMQNSFCYTQLSMPLFLFLHGRLWRRDTTLWCTSTSQFGCVLMGLGLALLPFANGAVLAFLF